LSESSEEKTTENEGHPPIDIEKKMKEEKEKEQKMVE
jgi:hypothetical protein